jgi:GAF domain-containing protein
MPEHKENLQLLRKVISQSGVRAGLEFLNKLTNHRFTALYRFDGEMLKNIFLFDRENPHQESTAEIPVLASYCVFVRDSGASFCVENSVTDARTVNHPKKLKIKSYCGVPLLDQFGKMFGTICHFDVNPRGTSVDNVALMEDFASLIEK